MIDAAVLEALGVTVDREGEREIRAFCPVHHLVMHRADAHPSWYMNRHSGAWLCFSCGQAGSLLSLVELLGGDIDDFEAIEVAVLREKISREETEGEPEEYSPSVYVSSYAFSKFPLPPSRALRRRGISLTVADRFHLKWDRDGRCFMIPVFSLAGELLGWQEKSVDYFNNVPAGMDISQSLFGYQQFFRGRVILVESPLDVMRMESIEVYGAMSTYGAYVSNVQLEAVRAVTDDVILAFDDDSAGHRGAAVCNRVLTKLGARVRFFRYPPRGDGWGKDPGDLSDDFIIGGVTRASSFMRAS